MQLMLNVPQGVDTVDYVLFSARILIEYSLAHAEGVGIYDHYQRFIRYCK